MGGGPTVSGGMSEAQYKQIQMEERQFMAQQEERQMKLMNEQEEKRALREQAEIQRQEGLRSKEEEALSKLEEGIAGEIEGLDEADKEEDKDIVMDFYGSLAQNDKPDSGAGVPGKKKKTTGKPKAGRRPK